MKESIMCALSTMNYLFLREVFKRNESEILEESELRCVVIEDLSMFLARISKEDWDSDFKALVKTELSEGSYLEDRNIESVRKLFKSAIKDICRETDDTLVNKYMNIVKEIYNGN